MAQRRGVHAPTFPDALSAEAILAEMDHRGVGAIVVSAFREPILPFGEVCLL